MFRFFYLDGQMCFFMLDRIKEQTSKSLPQSCSWKMWTFLEVQPNITLIAAYDAIWVGSDTCLFVYLNPVIVFIPGSTWNSKQEYEETERKINK